MSLKDPERNRAYHRGYDRAARAFKKFGTPMPSAEDRDYSPAFKPFTDKLAWQRAARKGKRQQAIDDGPDAYQFYRLEIVLEKRKLTLDQYHSIMERQDFMCGICKVRDVSGTDLKQSHVDHEHVTGKVRGILCPGCNTGLGKMLDGALFASASRYLKIAA